MSGPTDFDRLGDLLGEAWGAPPRAARGVSRDRDAKPDQSQRPSSGPSPSAPADHGALRAPAKLLAVIWPEVVGDEVAANAQPVQLKQGRLVVSASSSAWAQTLQLMGDAIAARINEHLGDGVVERVVFRHAGWEERPAGRPSAGRPVGERGPGPAGGAQSLSAEQKAVLAEVEALDLSPELREKIARAMEAAFVRAQQAFVRLQRTL